MKTFPCLKNRPFLTALIVGILSASLWFGNSHIPTVYAQESNTLVLSLSRDFGYSSGTGKIQGTFSMKVTCPVDLQKVVFYIDDKAIGEDNQPPFQYQFDTENYALGEHTLYALGYSKDGKEVSSNEIRAQFVSADEGWQAALKIAVPILGLSLGAMIISFALPFLFRRNKSNRTMLPESFGILGGAICPKCKLPFSLPLYKINLLFGALTPCPHCGKWSIVQRASPAELQAALNAAKSQQNPDIPIAQSEETIKKEIDDSRYMDL